MSPVYIYHCGKCERSWEALHWVSERDEEWCCDTRAGRRIPKSQGRPVVHEYFSESLNSMITSPKQKRKVMRDKGVEEAD